MTIPVGKKIKKLREMLNVNSGYLLLKVKMQKKKKKKILKTDFILFKESSLILLSLVCRKKQTFL